MSQTDFTFVTSPSALRMLQMVTAGFYDKSCIGQSIFQVIGAEWDEMNTWSTELHQELFPQTATWSIAYWEELYGIKVDESLSLELRRQQIMAKVLYRAPINPETIRRGVSALTGCEVEVKDFVAPYTFYVTVHHQQAIPNMTEVWEYIYGIKPSHLNFRLFFSMENFIEHSLHPALNQAQIVTKTIPEVIEITQTDVFRAEEDSTREEVN